RRAREEPEAAHDHAAGQDRGAAAALGQRHGRARREQQLQRGQRPGIGGREQRQQRVAQQPGDERRARPAVAAGPPQQRQQRRERGRAEQNPVRRRDRQRLAAGQRPARGTEQVLAQPQPEQPRQAAAGVDQRRERVGQRRGGAVVGVHGGVGGLVAGDVRQL